MEDPVVDSQEVVVVASDAVVQGSEVRPVTQVVVPSDELRLVQQHRDQVPLQPRQRDNPLLIPIKVNHEWVWVCQG